MLDLNFMIEILPRILKASYITLQISFLSLIFSAIFGILVSMLALNSGKIINILIRCFVEFTRGVPTGSNINNIFFVALYWYLS